MWRGYRDNDDVLVRLRGAAGGGGAGESCSSSGYGSYTACPQKTGANLESISTSSPFRNVNEVVLRSVKAPVFSSLALVRTHTVDDAPSSDRPANGTEIVLSLIHI